VHKRCQLCGIWLGEFLVCSVPMALAKLP
jgi:hypothetical protein